jgi:hypothetical protein
MTAAGYLEYEPQYLMQHSEIVTVADGKVAEIDSVCTGARPS